MVLLTPAPIEVSEIHGVVIQHVVHEILQNTAGSVVSEDCGVEGEEEGGQDSPLGAPMLQMTMSDMKSLALINCGQLTVHSCSLQLISQKLNVVESTG